MEGDLWKKSEHWRKWNQRAFRLEGHNLVWFAKKSEKPKGQIVINSNVIIATQESKVPERWPFSVTFNNGKYVLYLAAASKSVRSDWIKALSSVASGTHSHTSPAQTRQNSRNPDSSPVASIEAEDETTLFRSLAKVSVMELAVGSGSSSNRKSSSSSWRELKNQALVRIVNNDTTGDVRCVIQDRSRASSSTSASVLLDQPIHPRCKIHRYNASSRTSGWTVPVYRPSDRADIDKRSQSFGNDSDGPQLRVGDEPFKTYVIPPNRSGNYVASFALSFVSPQLADQFAYEYEKSRQRMKKVLSRRFASAREHRHSTDSRSSVTRDNGGSDQLSRLQGGAYSGGGAIRRGGARKAHSWDVSTYRYTRSGEHLSPENDRPAPSRRVATTPGAALVASATPPPSRTPSEHKSSDKYSLTRLSDSLHLQHKGSDENITAVDPRVRAVASVKAEALNSGADLDYTSVKWENEALRHQVLALKNVLKEREESIRQKDVLLAEKEEECARLKQLLEQHNGMRDEGGTGDSAANDSAVGGGGENVPDGE